MLFNSNEFLLFFLAFSLAYAVVRRHLRARNLLIVVASYLFYGWWDVRFLGLIVLSSLTDYALGRALGRTSAEPQRRRLLTASLVVNLGLLGVFKYYGFFADSLGALLGIQPTTLHVVLPVGISFYTFQTISYTFDVYRRRLEPTHDLVAFLAYVAYFPQLVAGPIERARHLLPQFTSPRTVRTADVETGLWLIVWGLFKKVVVADNLAPLVDMVYQGPVPAGPLVFAGTVAFAFQIYCDFSGYTDIARGLAKTMGFDLMLNFNLPYIAHSLRDFWQRWHISLSTWFRDYLYIPLGGNRRGSARTYFNLLLTMTLAGLWHGAAWHFVAWGVWHGAALAIERKLRPNASSPTFAGRLITLAVVLYGWLLFRAESLDHAIALTRSITRFDLPTWFGSYLLAVALCVAPVVLIQTWQLRRGDLLAPLKAPRWLRSLLIAVLILAIVLYWQTDGAPFIYFQF